MEDVLTVLTLRQQDHIELALKYDLLQLPSVGPDVGEHNAVVICVGDGVSYDDNCHIVPHGQSVVEYLPDVLCEVCPLAKALHFCIAHLFRNHDSVNGVYYYGLNVLVLLILIDVLETAHNCRRCICCDVVLFLSVVL